MNNQTENTEVVLPIICPSCKNEINLGVAFSLLPPEEEKEDKTDDGEEEENNEQ